MVQPCLMEGGGNVYAHLSGGWLEETFNEEVHKHTYVYLHIYIILL